MDCAPVWESEEKPIDPTSGFFGSSFFVTSSVFMPEETPASFDETSLTLTKATSLRLKAEIETVHRGLSKYVKMVFIKPKTEFNKERLEKPEDVPGHKVSEDIAKYNATLAVLQTKYAEGLAIAYIELVRKTLPQVKPIMDTLSPEQQHIEYGLYLVYCGTVLEDAVNTGTKTPVRCIFNRLKKVNGSNKILEYVVRELKARFPKTPALSEHFRVLTGSEKIHQNLLSEAKPLAEKLVKENPGMIAEIASFNEHCRKITLYLNVHGKKGIKWVKDKGPELDASVLTGPQALRKANDIHKFKGEPIVRPTSKKG